jgi:hypothetical protein
MCRLRVSLWAADCTVRRCDRVAFLLQFAAGKENNRVERQDVGGVIFVDLRVMLVPVKLRSVMRGVSLSCRSLRRGRENNRVERQDIGGVKCVGCQCDVTACG